MKSQTVNSAMGTDVSPQFAPHGTGFVVNPNPEVNMFQNINLMNSRSPQIIASSRSPQPSNTSFPSSFHHGNANCQKHVTLASPSSRRTKQYKPKPKPKPKTLTLNKEVPPCTECGKRFSSAKALHGHMRCHPERNWRGINPPDKQTGHPAMRPAKMKAIMLEPVVTSVASAELSKYTEYEIEATWILVYMSKGGAGFEQARGLGSGSKSNKCYKKKNGVFEKKKMRSSSKIRNGGCSNVTRGEDGAIYSNPGLVVKREEGDGINLNPNSNPNVVLDLNLTPRD